MTGGHILTCLILLTTQCVYYSCSSFFDRKYKPPDWRKKEEVNYRQVEKQILDQIMGPRVYDPRIRPAGANGSESATLVFVNIFFRSFSKIDDVKMEYSFQITLRQQWNDGRLKFHDKLQPGQQDKIRYLTMTDASKVWMPDTFFRNEKIGAFHSILTPNLYVRVFPNGDVLYSIRVSLICSCNMYLALFPMDEQTCHLNVASYGWTKADLEYQWKDNGAVQFPSNFSLPGGFKLATYGSDYCDVETATGTYSCLKVNLTFARELSFYLVTIYVPCFMIVVVSWFSFWLDYKAVPARVSLGVTTLLAMSTTMGSIQRSLPPVAYTKAIDVWTGLCTFFVFSALLEYALVNYASRSDAQRAAKQKELKEKALEFSGFNAERIEENTNASMVGFSKKDPLLRRIEGAHLIPPGSIVPAGQVKSKRIHHRLRDWARNFQFQAKKIDVFSRVLFPSSFALFNCMYWGYYLTRQHERH